MNKVVVVVLVLAAGVTNAIDWGNVNTLSNNTAGACDYTETCTVGGIEGSCTSISGGCCAGTATAGYCSGSNDNQCCTKAACSTPQGSGTCMQTGACSGTSVPGYCNGADDIQCCVSGAPTPTPPTPTPPTPSGGYDRGAAMDYAKKWWNTANHNCATSYSSCSPWSYWGGESCGFPSQGGDCANFVSQCLIAGGHTPLTKSPCRGYPCGKEEIGAANLGSCLAQNYGWTSICQKSSATPPSGMQVGDVLIAHGSSCTDSEAHAMIITSVSGTNVKITCHSSDSANRSSTDYAGEFGYFDWLKKN